jgi:hypothetical protein
MNGASGTWRSNAQQTVAEYDGSRAVGCHVRRVASRTSGGGLPGAARAGQ